MGHTPERLTVNNGHSRVLTALIPAATSNLMRPVPASPIFQAGHEGPIPFARSRVSAGQEAIQACVSPATGQRRLLSCPIRNLGLRRSRLTGELRFDLAHLLGEPRNVDRRYIPQDLKVHFKVAVHNAVTNSDNLPPRYSRMLRCEFIR